MTLCVLGSSSLDDLEKLVQATGFGKIRGCGAEPSKPEKEAEKEGPRLAGGGARTDTPRFVYKAGMFDTGLPSDNPPAAKADAEALADAEVAKAADASGASGPSRWWRSNGGAVKGVMRLIAPVQDFRELSLVFPLCGAVDPEAKPHRCKSDPAPAHSRPKEQNQKAKLNDCLTD